ncbi:MAG: hypothetical protein Q6363_001750 [Candidatus Njordarchaeota archaeon]
MSLEEVVEATIRKLLSWEIENLTPEEKFEILADMVSNLMRMKLEQLLEEGYSVEEAVRILRRMIIEGEKPFR